MRAVMGGQQAQAVAREEPELVSNMGDDDLFGRFLYVAEASNTLTGHLQRSQSASNPWNIHVHAEVRPGRERPQVNVLYFSVSVDQEPDGAYAETWQDILRLLDRLNRIVEEIERRRLKLNAQVIHEEIRLIP